MSENNPESTLPKSVRGSLKFQKHVNILIWKAYVQRQRRWDRLALQCIFATILFTLAALIAKPVFLTTIETEPVPPLSSRQILGTLPSDTILGFTPNVAPFNTIMERAAELLDKSIIAAESSYALDEKLYSNANGQAIQNKVIWVLWENKTVNVNKFKIRSTEMSRLAYSIEDSNAQKMHVGHAKNPYMRAGFLAVQLAISRAVLEHEIKPQVPNVKLSLVAMPVSPLMDRGDVKSVISLILMCFTLALLPPVLETESLIVKETQSKLKRSLRLRNVSFNVIYVGWVAYALLTALPVVFLGAVTMILIFRWIHIITALVTLLTYTCVMIIMSMIMAMHHEKGYIACVWTTLFTFLQTFLAELMVHHEYNQLSPIITFVMHMFLPPLGLVHALNQFALLQTTSSTAKRMMMSTTIVSWVILIAIYFMVLMLLQRTIGYGGAIGGQQSWKSIIFKKATDQHKLKPVPVMTGEERKNLQPVDEFVAKAVSFRNVSKDIMGQPVLSNLNFDIYRCEFSMLFSERIQMSMMLCLENLLTGLTFADSGTIHILGDEIKPGGVHLMNMPHKMGYCDQSDVLIDDLTVEEHLDMFLDICLWQASQEYVLQYRELRFTRLLMTCDLEDVKHIRVKDLDIYYRAQLCWALTILLEPKVVVMPSFVDHPIYKAVISDKILRYKDMITIIKVSYASLQLENADRVFVFDNRGMCFGGTPAYMFFKYGRDYRVRITLKRGEAIDDDNYKELQAQAEAAGATVRSHLGSLLILRVPTYPTENVAKFVKELENRTALYGITSLIISLPDSEEIFRRSLRESRPGEQNQAENSGVAMDALKRIAEPREWKLKETQFSNMIHFRIIGRKYISFYTNHRLYLVITILSAILAGASIGLTMARLIDNMLQSHTTKQLREGKVMTVEALSDTTALVLRVQDSEQALKLAQGYVLSEANATASQIETMSYIALPYTESLTEYLVTKAIDSPENYVFLYAYGLDIATDLSRNFDLTVLYSPMHHDQGAPVRSLARAFTSLLRYYTTKLDASIEVTDYPLLVELTPWVKQASSPPLLIQFLLVLTISHITLIPSNEYGLIRHSQSHALNFSPARYWVSLFVCDLIHYWVLVITMCMCFVGMMLLIVPFAYIQIYDLLAVPFMMVMYGLGCIPQAYLFSLGPRPALNSMALVIVNIVFGEATIVAKLFDNLSGLLYMDSSRDFMVLSPQYNMAYALVKIRTTFLYNSECNIFEANKSLCLTKILHKCCEKCGVLEPCFENRSYMHSIQQEAVGCAVCCIVFMSLLFLWEYRVIQRFWHFIYYQLKEEKRSEIIYDKGFKDRAEAEDKERQIKTKKSYDVKHDTFGEYLLAVDVSMKQNHSYLLRDIYLGIGKGEALAVSGLKRHGRVKLCELLAGYKLPSQGRIWTMSKHKLNTSPHMYCRNVTICCERSPLPGWMKVFDGLEMIAILRGVPKKHTTREILTIIEALDLNDHASKQIAKLPLSHQKRLHFAAAVVGAPPVVVLDECTAYQPYSVRRAMYHIIYHLRRRGHAIFISDSDVEGHMPVSNRLGILLDGCIADIDHVDRLLERYSDKGYTVVIHLMDDVDVREVFRKYFKKFVVNDMSEVLVNVQVLDELNWSQIFEKMEQIKTENTKVYSYIVCAVPIDYIYNTMLSKEIGLTPTSDMQWKKWLRNLFKKKTQVTPRRYKLSEMRRFDRKYDITTLKELPWSVIFHT